MATNGIFQNNNNSNDTRKKADAFINVSIPTTTESGKSKVGNGLALYMDRNAEKSLIEAYQRAVGAGKEAEFNQWLATKITIDFRLAVPAVPTELAIEDDEFLASIAG